MPTKAVFLLALQLIELDDIDQPTMSGRCFKALCEIWVFKVEPLCNGLMRVASTKPADDLPVMAIAADSLQYRPLPQTFFPQISIVRVQIIGIISYFAVVALEIGIVLSQILDFLDEVILMCFGVRLVDASEFACCTSTANTRSGPVTLEKKKQPRKLAFAKGRSRRHMRGMQALRYRPGWGCIMVVSYLLPGRSARSTGHSRHATGSTPFALRCIPTTARATSSPSCPASAPSGSRSGSAGARIVKFGRRGRRGFRLLI